MATAETKPQVSEFLNEPFIDFSRAENKTRMEEALKKSRSRTRPRVPDVHRRTESDHHREKNVHQSFPPFASHRCVFQSASVEQANQAVEAAAKAFESWKRGSRRAARAMPVPRGSDSPRGASTK